MCDLNYLYVILCPGSKAVKRSLLLLFCAPPCAKFWRCHCSKCLPQSKVYMEQFTELTHDVLSELLWHSVF